MNEIRTQREIARVVAGGYEDHQKVRLSTMNRIRDIVRKINEGIPFDQVEEKKEERTFEKKYQDKHLAATIKQMLDEKKLTREQYDYLVSTIGLADEAKELEGGYAKVMAKRIGDEPVYNVFFEHVRGIGPTTATQLIKEYGYCERFETVSKLWKMSGLDVQNGHAPKRVKGEKSGFDPNKRTLAWKVADLLIKLNSPLYRGIYDTTKEKELARTDENKPASVLHAHKRAARKMVKLFLAHFWEAGRELSGLETRAAYVQEHLGHTSIISYKDVLEANGVNV